MSAHHRRWPVLFLLLLAAVGLWRLKFDVEILHLLPSQLPDVRGLAIYNEQFSSARELVISVAGENADEVETAARAIAFRLRDHTNRVEEVHWRAPWIEHPTEAASMIAQAWANEPPERFQQLMDRLEPQTVEATLQAARARLTTSLSPAELGRLGYDPLGLAQLPGTEDHVSPFGSGEELFSSDDGTFRLVFVQASSPLTDYRECTAWYDAIRSEVEGLSSDVDAWTRVRVGYTGRPAFVSEIAGAMQSDMTRSVIGTGLIVAALFWWAQRRFKPMAWMLLLMATTIGLTLVLGGLIYGPLSVVSIGFAAILLGLTADYGMVLFQEWREGGRGGTHAADGPARRGIRWSAFTTAGAFLMLNFSGLPGLSQLGTLVAIGIGVGSVLMLNLFLKPFENEKPASHASPRTEEESCRGSQRRIEVAVSTGLSAVLLVCAGLLLSGGFPKLNRSPEALRPRTSQAYDALDEIQRRLGRTEPSQWIIVAGKDESQVGERLDLAQAQLHRLQQNGLVADYTLPTSLWPRPENLQANRSAMRQVVTRWPEIESIVQASGFSTNALALGRAVVRGFEERVSNPVLWPDNPVARWSLDQFAARTPEGLFAMGLIHPSDASTKAHFALDGEGEGWMWVVGWDRLGVAIADLVRRDLMWVLLPTVLLILVCLSLAFRSVVEVVLALGSLTFALGLLCALMQAAGWSWNLLNLMALPLLLGVGVDYSIHTLLALRHHAGDVRRTRRSVGRALFLCAATTATAFGSLAFSNNGGLSSLGRVCATGVILVYGVTTFLLPGWWLLIKGRPEEPGSAARPGTLKNVKPSSFYGAAVWRLGLWVARTLPYPMLTTLARMVAVLYRHLARHRFETVLSNLQPLQSSPAEASRLAKRLFTSFAQKLIDLWVYESGADISHLFGQLRGLEHVHQAQASGRGILLVTPHLGNWEFGAPLLTRQGLSMQVVTLAEPDGALTELRKQSRARWNIETVVIGNDAFGFVDLIRRLESGALVALLVDRPTAATATTVELFGRPIQASSAPAELARATGCTILPVFVVREDGHYTATSLAPIEYDRPSLRDPANRQRLTQKILRAFEAPIRQHPEQWYHFVPVWPPSPSSGTDERTRPQTP